MVVSWAATLAADGSIAALVPMVEAETVLARVDSGVVGQWDSRVRVKQSEAGALPAENHNPGTRSALDDLCVLLVCDNDCFSLNERFGIDGLAREVADSLRDIPNDVCKSSLLRLCDKAFLFCLLD